MRHRDRAEEALLGAVALLLLALLGTSALGARLSIACGIAIALVLVLVLRGADWHTGGATPFDWILLGGVAVSVAHLATILTGVSTPIGYVLVLAAAAFYATLAILLARHRGWLFRVHGE